MLCRYLIGIQCNGNSSKDCIRSHLTETDQSGKVFLNFYIQGSGNGTTHEIPHHGLAECINKLVNFLCKITPVVEIFTVGIRHVCHQICLVALLMCH